MDRWGEDYAECEGRQAQMANGNMAGRTGSLEEPEILVKRKVKRPGNR